MHQILKIKNRLKLFFVVLQIEVDGEKIALSKTYFWDFETKSCKVNEIKVSSVEKKDVEIATPNFESAQKINLTKSAMARQKLITMLTEKIEV